MPAPFESTELTRTVTDIFRRAADGDGDVSWADLCAATGKTRPKLNGAITSARRTLLREGHVFEGVRNSGYRLVPSGGLWQIGAKANKHARRRQHVGLVKMSTARMDELDPTQRVRHITFTTVLELGLMSTRPKIVKEAEKMAQRAHNQATAIDLAELVRAINNRRT